MGTYPKPKPQTNTPIEGILDEVEQQTLFANAYAGAEEFEDPDLTPEEEAALVQHGTWQGRAKSGDRMCPYATQLATFILAAQGALSESTVQRMRQQLDRDEIEIDHNNIHLYLRSETGETTPSGLTHRSADPKPEPELLNVPRHHQKYHRKVTRK